VENEADGFLSLFTACKKKPNKPMLKDSDAVVVRLALESESWAIQQFW